MCLKVKKMIYLLTYVSAWIIFTGFSGYFLTSATGLTNLARFQLNGFGCTNSVFILENGISAITCATKCSETPACAAVSYNSFTKKCIGCFMFKKENVSQDGVIFYGILGGMYNFKYSLIYCILKKWWKLDSLIYAILCFLFIPSKPDTVTSKVTSIYSICTQPN